MTKPRRAASRQPTPAGGRRHSQSQDSVRVTAAWALERVLASRAPVHTFLEGPLERFEDRDRGLLTELVLGTLRWLRRIDAVIAAASSRPVEKIDAPLLAPLRIATYQILFLDRVPSHAAVNEAVDQARRFTHRGGASFTNAVLRRIARSPNLSAWPVRESDPVRRLGVELSHPDFLVERWIERFGEDRTRGILEANNRPKPLHLLAFRDRGGRELLAESLIDEGLEVDPAFLSPVGLVVRAGNIWASEAFQRGDVYIQDEASQAAALVPPPQPGERIFDAAAAPGGKAFALLAAEPTVRLTLADVSLPRLGVLGANLSRLGRSAPRLVADGARPAFGAPEGEAPFDRVVLDLPCTGTGTLRKHPELKWRISPEEVGRLSRETLAILQASAPLVAPGGLLVAITCSLEKEENEDVAEAFMAAEGGFERVDLAPLLTAPMDRAVRGPGLWRVFPFGDHDGFTVQVLRRVGP